MKGTVMLKFVKMLPLAVLLAGCGSINAIPIIGPAVTSVTTAPTVAAAVTALCGFVPYVEDVASVISANPLVTTVSAYANLICSGLTKSGKLASRHGGGAPAVANVNGITVRGHF